MVSAGARQFQAKQSLVRRSAARRLRLARGLVLGAALALVSCAHPAGSAGSGRQAAIFSASKAPSQELAPEFVNAAAILRVTIGFRSDPGLVTLDGGVLASAIRAKDGATYQLPGDVDP
ncbi:MAG TPA: hypothetical protein VFC51_17495, partial [Chloroflexota bacterium]|nr:hypothetical protein [Chloroflexota bacterium]